MADFSVNKKDFGAGNLNVYCVISIQLNPNSMKQNYLKFNLTSIIWWYKSFQWTWGILFYIVHIILGSICTIRCDDIDLLFLIKYVICKSPYLQFIYKISHHLCKFFFSFIKICLSIITYHPFSPLLSIILLVLN